jgi:hypothetical protein
MIVFVDAAAETIIPADVRRVIAAGSVIGSGSGRSGRAFAIPR